MKFVVDANVLFALVKSSSVANELLFKHSLKLIAPDFALIELSKYKKELLKKSDFKTFKSLISSLKQKVIFVDISEYKELLKKMLSEISDPKDITYLALALKFKLPIWSNDKHFKEQSLVDSFTTKELIELLN